MPKRIPRYVGRFVREHLLLTIIVLVAISATLSGVAVYRYSQVTQKIIQVQVVNCRTGNVARGQIRFLTTVLRNLIDVSLAIPPNRTLTPQEMVARANLIRTFAGASHLLTRRLPDLAPRNCDKSAIIDGAPVAPAR